MDAHVFQAHCIAQGFVEAHRALDVLEAAPPAWKDHPDYGHLTLAAALGYMDFRHAGRWRANRPTLAAWYAVFAERPSMIGTAPLA